MTKNNQRILLGGVWVLIGLLSIASIDNPWPGVGMIALGIVLIIVYAIRRGRAHPAP